MYFSHLLLTSSLLRPKYSPQHTILKQPQPTFLPQCRRPSFTPIQTTGKVTVLYILIFIFFVRKLEDKRFCIERWQAFPDFNLTCLSTLYVYGNATSMFLLSCPQNRDSVDLHYVSTNGADEAIIRV
jgi:hypothetical protein